MKLPRCATALAHFLTLARALHGSTEAAAAEAPPNALTEPQSTAPAGRQGRVLHEDDTTDAAVEQRSQVLVALLAACMKAQSALLMSISRRAAGTH